MGPYQVLEAWNNHTYRIEKQGQVSIQNENILGGQDPVEYLVTYYETLQDAQSGENSVSTDYTNTSNPQQIFARVENIDAVGSNSGCFSISDFMIEVTGAVPDAISPEEYVLCNPLDLSNTQVFDLSSQDEIILEGQNVDNFDYNEYPLSPKIHVLTKIASSPVDVDKSS